MTVVGEAFFTPESRKLRVKRHLWVVLSEEDADGKVAIANFSSDCGPNDRTEVIGGHEHPSLSHDSHVRCDEARLAVLTQFRGLPDIQWTKAAPASLVLKMKTILLASKHTPREVKDALNR